MLLPPIITFECFSLARNCYLANVSCFRITFGKRVQFRSVTLTSKQKAAFLSDLIQTTTSLLSLFLMRHQEGVGEIKSTHMRV